MRDRQRLVSAAAALLVAALAAGCAADRAPPPQAPELQRVAPAEQALEQASQSQLAERAPRMMAAARRRVSEAKSIAYNAARARRDLSPVQQDRIERLVAAAQLDIRAAQAKGQARAASRRLAQLQGAQSEPGATPGSASSARQALRPSPDRENERAVPTGSGQQSPAGQATPSQQRPLPSTRSAPGTGVGNRSARPNSISQ